MEHREQSDEEDNQISQADQRKRQREIKRQKDQGVYMPSLLEEAKQIIASQPDPSLVLVLSQPRFALKFNDKEVHQLRTYVSNIKQKRKAGEPNARDNKFQELEIRERASQFLSQKIDDLHQSILMPPSEAERAAVIKLKIDENIFNFLEYMENYPSPTQDFLRVIVGLKGQLESDSFTSLFVRVCAKHQGESLLVDEDTAQSAMVFLVDQKVDQSAAFGLLRLVFMNEISLTKFEVPLLLRFQDQYQHAILRSHKSMGVQEHQMIALLPATCFIFTRPLIQSLKKGGQELHQMIPPQFLPYVLEILSYSFEDSQENFKKFLQIFKDGCKKHYQRLLNCKFTDLLKGVLSQVKEMKHGFFQSLDKITEVLSKSFSLIEERQIESFDPATMTSLIDGGDEEYKLMRAKPKVLKGHSQKMFDELISQVQNANKGIDFSKFSFQNNLEESDLEAFKALGIASLLPVQTLCFQYCMQIGSPSLSFIQYETGQGKTSLCLGLAMTFASHFQQVLVVNSSKDLLFRDFKKVNSKASQLGIKVQLLQSSKDIFQQDSFVVFCDFEQLRSLVRREERQEQCQYTMVIDEFDSIFFEEPTKLNEILKVLKLADQIFCFTGSELEDYHKQYLQQSIKGAYLNFSCRRQNMSEVRCIEKLLFQSKRDFIAAISEACAKEVQRRPVVIVCDDSSEAIWRALIQKQVPAENLADQESTLVESSICTFTLKQNSKYPAFIVNESQGRGIDFGSNTDIENGGGVHVMICLMPSYSLQFRQFIGRTGRIGNKGTYGVYILDKKSKNQDPAVFLEKRLDELKNRELLQFNAQSADTNASQDDHIAAYEHNTSKDGGAERLSTDHSSVTNADMLKNSLVEQYEQIQNNLLKDGGEAAGQNIQKDNLQRQPEENDTNEESKGEVPAAIRKREIKKLEKHEMRLFHSSFDQEKMKVIRDRYYFELYSKNEIHIEMCKDSRRMDAYKLAIQSLCGGKIVADVGAGTGVLSIYAAASGAAKVFAIEKADIVKKCKKNVKAAGFQNVIKIQDCLAEDCVIDSNTVDVIVSEWMGYFLLMERMLPSVLAARDKLLTQNGQMIPKRAKLFLCAANLVNDSEQALSVPSGPPNLFQARISFVSPDNLLSESACVLDLDLLTADACFDSFEAEVKLSFFRSGVLNGLIGWFDAEMSPETWFSTSPREGYTHWQHTVFPFTEKVDVSAGQTLSVKLVCRPIMEDHRGLHVFIEAKVADQQKTLENQYYLQ